MCWTCFYKKSNDILPANENNSYLVIKKIFCYYWKILHTSQHNVENGMRSSHMETICASSVMKKPVYFTFFTPTSGCTIDYNVRKKNHASS